MLYIIVDHASGAQKRVFREEWLAVAGDGEALVIDETRTEEPDPLHYRWNTETRAYEAYSSVGGGPVVRTRGTRLEFSRRVGFARESLLHQLRRKPDLPDAAYGDITTMLEWLNRATDVNLTDPATIAQANALGDIFAHPTLMALVSATPFTVEERAAYVVALLVPWDTLGE